MRLLYMYVCTFALIYVYVHIYKCMCAWIVHVYFEISLCECMHVCTYVCMYVHMYVCMHAGMQVGSFSHIVSLLPLKKKTFLGFHMFDLLWTKILHQAQIFSTNMAAYRWINMICILNQHDLTKLMLHHDQHDPCQNLAKP